MATYSLSHTSPFGLFSVHMYVCGYMHMSVIPKEARRGWWAPELEFEVIVSHLMWMLEMGLSLLQEQ